MGSRSLLKTKITGISPKTSSSLNTRIYVSNPCLSTNRSQCRPTILRKASRLRALLASPLYQQEREASAERLQVYHSEREKLMSISSQDPMSRAKLVALFSSKKDYPIRDQPVFGSSELFFRFSDVRLSGTDLRAPGWVDTHPSETCESRSKTSFRTVLIG